MKILHISDFHYKSSPKDIAAQNELIDKLLLDLNEERIDFFLFTGDLVFSGKNKEDFNNAYKCFIEKVGQKLKILGRNIFFCPGNHDVDRSQVNDPIKNYLRDIKTDEQLTQIVEANKPDVFGLSCKPTRNYFEFEKNYYKKGIELNIDEVNPLYSVHLREIEGRKIGFVCINTAWCSSGDDDKNNLFFPKSELQKALQKLKEYQAEWKVLLLHHPLNDLREFNKINIEDLIYSEFHLMFSGHLHKREDFVRLTQNEGIFGTYAYASFTKKEDGKIGYTIVDIDLTTLDISILKRVYDYDERAFLPLKSMNCTLPANETKKAQIKIYKTLRKRSKEIIEKANELFVNTKDHSDLTGFLELFVDPVLKTKPNFEVGTTLTQSPKVPFKQLYEKRNFLLYGKDKTGKTSLLYKIYVDLLQNYSEIGEIPIYIDLTEYKIDKNKLDIIKLFSQFIELPYENAKRTLKQYNIKLLLDNFDPAIEHIKKILVAFIEVYKNCSYIIVADQTLARSVENLDYGFNSYETLFIHDISRYEIIQLTKKWPNIPEEKRESFVDKIIEVLKQHSMPFNFWTLSIFLWIFAGKNTLNFNNNSELIELYIDDLLDRNRLASDPQNRFSYQNYKLLLAKLAHELLKHHVDTNYSFKYSELITFTEKFLSQNIKRVGKTSEIVNYLLERGVLKKIDNDYITFRLNGVFEYFVAFDFIENQQFLEEIISNDNYYLSFKNEFEIYSGFQRNESENTIFLKNIFTKTKAIFNELNERMQGDLDLRLDASLSNNELLDISEPIATITSNPNLIPLNDQEKDLITEQLETNIVKNVDVQPKKTYDVSIKKFDILEKYLFINGRVFKNIENVSNSELIDNVFDFIVDSSCNLGFLLIEEMEADVNNQTLQELDGKNPQKLIFQLINNYLPSVVQSFISESIGHINLEGIVLKKIEEYKANYRIHQYKLFILYCFLLDIDFKKYKRHIEDMITYSKMGIIKSSILIKLFYLLIFKSYDNDSQISFLKEKIRQVNLQINPKLDMRAFDQSFEKTKKFLLLKRK